MSDYNKPTTEIPKISGNFNKAHPELELGEEFFNNMTLAEAYQFLRNNPGQYRIGNNAYDAEGRTVPISNMIDGKNQSVVPVFKIKKTE